MYINDCECIEANDGYQQITCRILHTHGRHCCFDVWQTFRELPDSRTSSSKRQVTPFLYIGSRPAASTLGLRHSCVPMAASQQNWSGSENDAKIRNFYEYLSLYTKKERKIAFHKACETFFWAKTGRNISKNLAFAEFCHDASKKISLFFEFAAPKIRRFGNNVYLFAPSESTTLPVE